MLTCKQKQSLLWLIEDELKRRPETATDWRPIIGEIANDLRRHRTAIQRATERNAAKKSRRDQRGPII